MSDDDAPRAYGVLVEFKEQGPILMEMESRFDLEAAVSRLDGIMSSHRAIRGCIVRLTYERGNEALLRAIERPTT